MGLLDFLKKKKVARPLININADTKATINLATPHKKPRKAVKARKAHRAKARTKRRKK